MNFIALYRGPTVSEARLVAVCSEPEIVSGFLRELGGENGKPKNDGVEADRNEHARKGPESDRTPRGLSKC
jgi:hypothetical protein